MIQKNRDEVNTPRKQGWQYGKPRPFKSGDVRDLRGVVEREEAALGVFITLEEPTRDMVAEAASSGFYHSPVWDKGYPASKS